jgi:hypothetical protein
MASGSHAAAGANRLHRKELQPTILAEQARLTDRKSDRPLKSVKTTCPQTGRATVPWDRSAESTNRRSDQVSSSRPPAKVYQQDELSPVNKVIVNEGTLCDPVPLPDYGSLLSRSLDLLDRRYDNTPEGRSEAKKLALELELMKPPDSKPPKGYFGEVVSLVRRLRAHQQRKPAAAVNAPRPSPAPAAPNASSPASPPAAPSAASAAHSNLPPPPVSRSEPSPKLPVTKPGPPNHPLPPLPERQAARSPVTPVPSSVPSPAAPVPGITLTRTGHTTDWYAPASWSGNSAPDPFPSRQEKLKRDLRSMSSARWRHLQHQNSRGF